MARLPIPPTRSNYLHIAATLERARQGCEMLERKRQILTLELMGRVGAARQAQGAVREALAGAYEALEEAAAGSGAERLVRESAGIPEGQSVQVRSRSLMGVRVPQVSFERAEQRMPFGFASGAAGADEVLRRFRAALEPIARLAELENAVLRLAREVKRTQRRANALEQTLIPNHEDTLKFIAESLEEREREDLVVMKKVKTMRLAARRAPHGPPGAEGHDG